MSAADWGEFYGSRASAEPAPRTLLTIRKHRGPLTETGDVRGDLLRVKRPGLAVLDDPQ